MQPQRARLDRSGRLVLPAGVREALELREGDDVVFVPSTNSPDEVTLIPRKAALRRSRQLLRSYLSDTSGMIDELIADRRADAAREEAEWQERERRLRS